MPQVLSVNCNCLFVWRHLDQCHCWYQCDTRPRGISRNSLCEDRSDTENNHLLSLSLFLLEGWAFALSTAYMPLLDQERQSLCGVRQVVCPDLGCLSVLLCESAWNIHQSTVLPLWDGTVYVRWSSGRHLASGSEGHGFESWLCQVDVESWERLFTCISHPTRV